MNGDLQRGKIKWAEACGFKYEKKVIIGFKNFECMCVCVGWCV